MGHVSGVRLPLYAGTPHNGGATRADAHARERAATALPRSSSDIAMHDRRHFLKMLAVSSTSLALGCKSAGVSQTSEMAMPNSSPARMPILFVGHGSPMNVVEDNQWSRGFAQLGEQITKPKAILAVSAHWFVNSTMLTSNAQPRTIHDFGGFPQPLYEIEYPAPGNLDLAKQVRKLLGEERASLSDQWGLDHGTWSVLKWMYPTADIPVIQLSINYHLNPRTHLEIGRSLAALRREGVLIFASGNITHNLRDAMNRRRSRDISTPDWAQGFDDDVAKALQQHDTDALAAFWPNNEAARLSHPTPDHWLPLLYAAGAADGDEDVRFPIQGFDLGSLSMRSVIIG